MSNLEQDRLGISLHNVMLIDSMEVELSNGGQDTSKDAELDSAAYQQCVSRFLLLVHVRLSP